MANALIHNRPDDSLKDLFVLVDGRLRWNPDHKDNQTRQKKPYLYKDLGFNNKASYPIISLKGKQYSLGRLTYWFVTGEWPEIIDHADHNIQNNHIDNLRACNESQNQANKAKVTVKPQFRHGKYYARIQLCGKSRYIDKYDTEIQAINATNMMKVILHREFANIAN